MTRLHFIVNSNMRLRFSYKHAIDGLYRVYKFEGPANLFSGATMASSRAIFVTVGQVGASDGL